MASVVFHAMVLALATGFWRRPAREDPRETHLTEDPGRAVTMVFLPPPPAARRPEAPPRPAPTPTPAPESKLRDQQPPENVAAAAPPPPAASAPEIPSSRPQPVPEETGVPVPPAAPPPPTHTAEAPTPTLESEARRLFGPPPTSRPPADSGSARGAASPFQPWRPAYADRANCPPDPPATDSAGRAALGTVTGQVFSSGDHHPLAGAYLQIIGTPYGTYTDANGAYRLMFDASLVANCRTQYVRVTAKGYEGRMLILAAGRNFRSDDVLLGRR